MMADMNPSAPPRVAERRRVTRETDVAVRVNLDMGAGEEPGVISTSAPFLDHMLGGMARHGRLGFAITATGDTQIDDHHIVEDVGLTLGQTLLAALGERRGIARFGYAYGPMDEALARVVIDIAGRPFVSYVTAAVVLPERVGAFDTQLIEEFWRAFTVEARMTLHVDVIRGRNAHHIFEAMFKAAGLALGAATRVVDPGGEAPSTKGMLG
jgi:imidazoleglycerol-phosphate dehydratase